MRLLVDGHHAYGHGRRRLLASLARLCNTEGHTASVVFTRPVDPRLLELAQRSRIAVRYAGRTQSTGEAIVDWVHDRHDGPGLTLVTNYLPLAQRLERYGIRTVSWSEFSARLTYNDVHDGREEMPRREVAPLAPASDAQLARQRRIEVVGVHREPTPCPPRPYDPSARYHRDETVFHATWGLGRVTTVGDTVLHVRFADGSVRRLAHAQERYAWGARGARAAPPPRAENLECVTDG